MQRPEHKAIITTDDDGYAAPHSYWSRSQVIEMNLAFGHALINAIHNGLEKYPLRPKVDDSPWVPTHYDRAPNYSGMTSSATLCAESGIDTAGQGYPMGRR